MDKITETLRLQELKRLLSAFDWDSLDLRHLNPLRAEVEVRFGQAVQPTEPACTRCGGSTWERRDPECRDAFLRDEGEHGDFVVCGCAPCPCTETGGEA